MDNPNESFEVSINEDGVYVVNGPKIDKMLGYTNLESEKGFDFFQKFMKRSGVLDELEKLELRKAIQLSLVITLSLITIKHNINRREYMTSKQRAYLKGLAMTMDPIFQFGKNSLTPENTAAIAEALEARELIKISVLNNCADDPREIAQMVAERTRSQVVQVIGKKIVLYKESKDNKKIILP